MVTIKIYLSTATRIKANPEDWDESFNGGNHANFTKIIEKDSYKISQGFSYGSAPKSQTFSCKISAEPYYVTLFEAYDYIKVVKVSNGTSQTVFIGAEPTFKRTVETADWWSETATFTDNFSKLEDKVFNEEDEDWTWKITNADGYKICDPSDTSKSLLHYLFNTYLNADNLLTLHCSYSDTTIATYFCVKADDSIMDIWQKFLEQQGLAYYLLCNDLYIIDILEDKSITATTVTNIEEKATIDDKPYVEKKVPTLQIPTIISSSNNKVYSSGDIYLKGDSWYPAEDMGLNVTLSYDYLRDNQEVLRYYNLNWVFDTDYKWNPELWIWDGDTKSKATNGNDKGTLSGSKMKYSIHSDKSYIVTTMGNLSIYADVDVLDYTQEVEPALEYRSGEEEKADYVFDELHAKRYIQALIYSKEMSAKTYSFYSTKDLSLNEICVINGFTKDGEYVRITDKQDNLDDFEGYTYKGTVYKGTQVSVSSNYKGYSVKEPYVNQDFNFSVSHSAIPCDSTGKPYDTLTSIRATVSLIQYFGTPTLYVGSSSTDLTQVTLTRETETVEGQEKLLDSYYYDIDLSSYTGDSIILVAQLGNVSKRITIEKVFAGASGWSHATVNLYKRSDEEQTAYDGEALTYNFSTDAITGSTGTWSRAILASTEKIWVISTSALSQSDEATLAVTDWTAPVVLAQNGKDATSDLKLCLLSCDKRTVTRNDRLSGAGTYTFSIDVRGFTSEPVLSINGEAQTLTKSTNGNKYTCYYALNYKNASAIVAVVSIDDIGYDTIRLEVVNETTYYRNYGAISTETATSLSDMLKGDTYVNTDTNLLMFYNGTEWTQFSFNQLSGDDLYMAGQILSIAEKSYWELYSSMTDEQKQELFNLYGYKAEVISKFIATKQIQMYGDGVIASSLISTDPTKNLTENGFLDTTGYRLEGSTGIIRAKNAYLSQIYIDALSKIYGEIQSDALTTHNGQLEKKTFKSNTSSNTKYWSYSDLYNAMSANAIISTSGNFEGNTVSKYAKITDSNAINATRYLRWLQVRSKTSTDGGSGYDKISIVDGSIAGQTLSTTYTNTTAYTQTMLLSYDLYNGDITTYDLVELTATVNGSKVASISTVSKKKGSTSFSLASGATVTVTLKCDGYSDEVVKINGWYASGSCGLVLQPSAFFSAGITSLGAWLYYGSAWHKLSEAGYKSTTLNLLGVTNSYIAWQNNAYEVIDDVMQSSPTAKGNYATVSSSSTVTAGSTTFTPDLVSWDSNGITFSNSSGQSLTISTGSFYKSFSFTIIVESSSSSVQSAKLLPNNSSVTIGDDNNRWNAVYAKTFFGNFSGTVYGAKFIATTLFNGSVADETTYSLSGSLAGYEWISISARTNNGAGWIGNTIIHSSDWRNHMNANEAIVCASDSQWAGFYFSSATSIYFKNKSTVVGSLKIVGYK